MKRLIPLTLGLAIFMICFAMPTIVGISIAENSGTTVGGIIESDTTWTLEGSPYIITETVQIPSGVTLTIEPGVNIQTFMLNFPMFLVHGKIYAHGTVDNKIVFDGKPMLGVLDYYSYIFSTEDCFSDTFIDLDYCIIRNGECFIWFNSYHFSLRHSEIANMGKTDIKWPKKDVYIEYNTFTNVQGFEIWTDSSSTGRVYIRYNLFNRFNIESWSSNSKSETIIKYNSFIDGTILKIEPGWWSLGLSAIENYWGTQDTDIIDSMIYDKNDDIRCDGDIDYLPILSEPHPDTPKISTAISCSVTQSHLTIGDSVTISGSINPAVSGATVTLSTKHDEGSWSDLTTVTTNSTYSYSWTPEAPGSYEVKASWNGYGVYEGATSDTVSVQVDKISTIISCSVSQSDLTIGNSVNTSGSITPPISDAAVTLTYKKPDNSTFTRTVTTSSNGSYTDTYEPDLEGIWSVNASWEGDENYAECTSPSASFTLDGSPPTLSITSPSIGSEIKSPDVAINWSGTDDLSGIDHYEIKLDEETWVDIGIDTSYVLTNVNDGSHIISIKAVDVAGNSEVEQISFTVNTSIIGGPGWMDDIAVIGGIGIITTIGLILILRRPQVQWGSRFQRWKRKT